MYREPLAPTPEPWPSPYLDELAAWENTVSPYSSRNRPLMSLSAFQLEHIAAKLQNAHRGLLLIGRLSTQEEYSAARKLAADIPWPVFADIGSHCRYYSSTNTNIHYYDSLLHSESFRRFCSPDFILHIGDVFVSKRLQEHLATIHPDYIQLHPRNDNRDPIHRVTQHYQVDIARACDKLRTMEDIIFPPSALLTKLQEVNQSVSTCINTYVKNEKALSEITIASIIKTMCPVGISLFIGNSMPIRDMDTVVDSCKANYIGVNRGVSGIDGNIATAAGMAWASDTPTLALVGDTTALHDLNSLALLHKTGAPVILIIINNGGGGIFSFLPIAQYKDLLGAYFTNAHSLHFEKAASLFDLPYYCAGTATELEQHLQTAINDKRHAVIEVIVNRDDNIHAHQALADRCVQESEAFFSE